MSRGRLLLRPATGPRVGAGHVMRCLALAQGWRAAGGEAVFVVGRGGGGWAGRRVDEEGFATVELNATTGSAGDAAATGAAAREGPAGWVVLDGYGFDAVYRERLTAEAGGARLATLDDLGGDDYRDVALVVNQNLHARRGMYRRRGPATRLLLGPRYLLLRDEILAAGRARAVPGSAPRLLVLFGGADPFGGVPRVLAALRGLGRRDLEVTAVSPAAGEPALAAAAAAAPFPVTVRAAGGGVAELMRRADLAITSGGTAVWELAYLGVPALVVTVSPAEERLAEGLRRRGPFAVLGPLAEVAPDALCTTVESWLADADRRRRCAAAARRLVDGRGRTRVVAAMTETEGEGE